MPRVVLFGSRIYTMSLNPPAAPNTSTSCAKRDPLPQLPDTPAGHLRPGSSSSRFPHNAGQHANFPLIKSSFDFQPRFPSKSKPITAMLSNGPSLNLHKARLSGPAPLSQPTLKIEEAHSLATANSARLNPLSSYSLTIRAFSSALKRPRALLVISFSFSTRSTNPNPVLP